MAILGTLKTGATCVPINKDDPYDRKARIISNVQSKTVLTSSALYTTSVGLAPNVFRVTAEFVAESLELASSDRLQGESSVAGYHPEDLAFISFTSSSAGAQKGVLLEHRGLVSSLASLAKRLDWQPSCRMLQFAPYSSSGSMPEILGPLLVGGCLCIPSEDIYHESPSQLSSFVASANVNWAMLAPSTLRSLSPAAMPTLKSVLSMGESLDARTAESWRGFVQLFNGWGTCETSVLNAVMKVTADSSHCPDSIGKAVGCTIWIVDLYNPRELAPIGSVGQLLVQGSVVAKGYLDDGTVKMTSSFVPPPSWATTGTGQGDRHLHLTGDLAKYDSDGSISFIGRRSNRVKLGADKIQLEELESVLLGCHEVKELVTLTKITAGRTQLVAVVCLADPKLPARKTAVLQELHGADSVLADECLKTVRTYARSTLHSDWIPSLWIVVEHLPRTSSHKLDRAAVREWIKTR